MIRIMSGMIACHARPALLAAAVAAMLVTPACAAAAQDAERVPVRIIAINDLHGHLEAGENAVVLPHPSDPTRTVTLRTGGVAALATRVQQLRAEVALSVFISTGDLIGASPLVSALFRDEPTVEAMNLVGLELNAVGNHEFDQGVAELRRMIAGGCATTPRGELATCSHPDGRYAGARFPFIAANVVDAADRHLLPPTWVKLIDGVKLGFIGAVTRSTPGIVMPAGIRGWTFRPEAAAINAHAAKLRSQGVQALVAVIHEGGEADAGINGCDNPRGAIFDIVRQLDASIDVVFSAHTHRGYNCLIDGRVVIQGASFGRLLSVVDVEIDRASGDVVRGRTQARNEPVPNGSDPSIDPAVRRAYPALAPDPQVAALVEHYRDRAAPIAARVLGRIGATFDRRPDPGGDHALGRLIADAHLAATRASGAQIAFTNPGGVRGDLIARAQDQTVTFADAFRVQPFGNTLVTLTLSGAQLKSLLESQWRRHGDHVRFLQPSRGFTYAWSNALAWGERVAAGSMRLNGQPIRAQQRYRITVNSYLAAGGDGFAVLRDATDQTSGPLDVDALAAYLRQVGSDAALAPDTQSRIRRLD
jgi:5'-nucleotidase